MSKKTIKELNKQRKRAKANVIDFNYELDKCVIFSDLHRGIGDSNDNFNQNETVYKKALDLYFINGYKIILAGDVFEGQGLPSISQIFKYQNEVSKTLVKEKLFVDNSRYFRIYGNHDYRLKGRFIYAKLKKILGGFKRASVFMLGNKIMIVHGYEGQLLNTTLRTLSIIGVFVKKLWFKLIGKIDERGKAYEYEKLKDNPAYRYKRDKIFYNWAKKNKLLLIAGHTHRAVFQSHTVLYPLENTIKKNKPSNLKNKEKTAKSLIINGNVVDITKILNKSKNEMILIEAPEINEENERGPNYFNTGACLYDDGMTCIEISNGQIKSVLWKNEEFNKDELIDISEIKSKNIIEDISFKNTTEREVIKSAELKNIFEKL